MIGDNKKFEPVFDEVSKAIGKLVDAEVFRDLHKEVYNLCDADFDVVMEKLHNQIKETKDIMKRSKLLAVFNIFRTFEDFNRYI